MKKEYKYLLLKTALKKNAWYDMQAYGLLYDAAVRGVPVGLDNEVSIEVAGYKSLLAQRIYDEFDLVFDKMIDGSAGVSLEDILSGLPPALKKQFKL